MPISLAMYLEWKEHPVTQRMVKILRDHKSQLTNHLVNGETLTSANTEKWTAYSYGKIQGLDLVLRAVEENELYDKEEKEGENNE